MQSCLKDAAEQYSSIIKQETGASKSCVLTIDKSFLPPAPAGPPRKHRLESAKVPGKDGPSCLGGVVLLCQGGKISVVGRPKSPFRKHVESPIFLQHVKHLNSNLPIYTYI